MTPLLSCFYFGSAEHYVLLARHPRVIIDIGEHYQRQSYRTRTCIVGPNGIQDLIVQVAHQHGKKTPMREMRTSHAETWPQQHLHAIRSGYGNTPWFIHYYEDIERVLTQRHERVTDLNHATMQLAMKWLGLATEVMVNETYVAHAPTSDYLDLRESLHPKKPLPPQVRPVPPYPQIFGDRLGLRSRMSVVDLVMNLGPMARGQITQDH
jgi:WbqC-like protein family